MKEILIMILGGGMLALAIPLILFSITGGEELKLWIGSIILAGGLIIFKIGDSLLWRDFE